MRLMSMQIYFEVGKEGASTAGKRGDVCVIVDVLRTSSSIIAALMGGIARIKLGDKLSDIKINEITVGEQDGRKIPEFHYGNSPVELLNNRHPKQELLFFSTNGIPCITACIGNDSVILVGALLNASAVSQTAKKIAEKLDKNISIVLAGYHGKLEQDDLIAGSVIYYKYLSSLPVLGNVQPIQSNDFFAELLASQAGLRLVSIGYENDIKFCSQLDITTLVPIYDYQSNKIKIL